MAEVPYYNPGQPPNLVVGTPGFNPAIGGSVRNLARDFGQVRQQLGQMYTAKAAGKIALLDPLIQQAPYLGSAIGGAIGGKIASLRKKSAADAMKQQQLIAQNDISQRVNNFQNFSDKVRLQQQKDLVNTPDAAVPQYETLTQNARDAYATDLNARYPNNPEYAASFRNQADDYIRSQKQGLGQWSLSQGKQNAEASLSNVQAQSMNQMASASGDLGQRRTVLYSQLKNVDKFATANAEVLGNDNVAKWKLQTSQNLGAAYFHDRISNPPELPCDAQPEQAATVLQGRISYFQGAAAEIDDHERWGIPLADGAQKSCFPMDI